MYEDCYDEEYSAEELETAEEYERHLAELQVALNGEGMDWQGCLTDEEVKKIQALLVKAGVK